MSVYIYYFDTTKVLNRHAPSIKSASAYGFVLFISCAVDHVYGLGKDKLSKKFAQEPENVLATFPSEPCGDSVLIQWAPPSQDILIQSYMVTCETDDMSGRVVELVDGDFYRAVVGPLKFDSTYTCSVVSRTKLHGNSDPSFTEPFVTDK